MLMVRDFSTMFQQMSGMPIGSKGAASMLKQAGIDTGSKQYQAVIKDMNTLAGGGIAYTNPQAIRNLMNNYDEDGDRKDPVTGLSGLIVTDKNRMNKNKIIPIPESSREEMFNLVKKEFLQNNGEIDGNTTKRGDVYTNLYKKMGKNERLAAGHTLEQYERAYRKALSDTVKSGSPGWKEGKPVPSKALDGITREAIDNTLIKSGGQLIRRSVNYSI